jgi:putative transposase
MKREFRNSQLRAKLVPRAEDWQWSSLWRRTYGDEKQRKLLAEWPVSEPSNYLDWVNEEENQVTLDHMRNTIRRGSPFGKEEWVNTMIKKFGLESTVKPRGRPPTKKGT